MGRVLVVDDQEEMRTVFARLVKACGHDADTAADGEDAICKATEHPPSLMILDLMMPGITGFDVLRALRADPRTSPIAIVVFSAMNDPQFIEQALSLGANDYWVKGSFDLETLRSWLTYYVDEGKR